MIDNFFKSVILVSCIGTVLAVLLMLLKPFTKKMFSIGWQYGIWLVVAMVMAIPIRFDTEKIEKMMDIPAHMHRAVLVSRSVFMPVTESKVFSLGLSEIWIFVAIVILMTKLISYSVFLSNLRKNSIETDCPEIARFTGRKVKVIKSGETASPLMLGIFKPLLVLPDREMTEQQLCFVLSHEMVHLKRQDIAVKWFVSFIKSIHWFNPAVYFISRQIDIECEMSCDAEALRKMDGKDRKDYAETILALAVPKKKKCPFTTGMASGKSFLKKRIISIAKLKNDGKLIKIISGTVVAICLIATIAISGSISGYLLNEVERRIVLTGKIPRIEFPVIPIKQKQAEKTVVKKERERVPENVIPNENVGVEQKLDENFTENVSIEPAFESEGIVLPPEIPIQQEQVVQEEDLPTESDELVENIKTVKYSTDDKTTHYINLQPDENGSISMYFDSEVQNAVATINIYDIERPGKGWGYKLPTNREETYEFDGFDPTKTYTVEINTYCPGNYGIEGEVHIY